MGKRLPDITIPNLSLPNGRTKISEDFAFMRAMRFHKYMRVRLNGMVGTMFWCDTISSAMESIARNSANVVLLSSRAEYAPEQISRVVFIADKRMIGA